MKRKAGGRAGDGNRNRRARTEGVEGEIFPLNELPDMILALIVSFLGLGDVFRLRRVNIKLRDLAGQYHSCFRQLQDLSTRLCSEFKSSPEEVRPSFDKTFQGIQQEAQRRIHQLRICQAKYWPRASESEKEVAVCLAKTIEIMAHARNNIGSVGVSTCLFAVPVPVSPDGKSEFLKVIVSFGLGLTQSRSDHISFYSCQMGFLTSSAELANRLNIPCKEGTYVLRVHYNSDYDPNRTEVSIPDRTHRDVIPLLSKLLGLKWGIRVMGNFLLRVGGCMKGAIKQFDALDWNSDAYTEVEVRIGKLVTSLDVLKIIQAHQSWNIKDLTLLQRYAHRLQCRMNLVDVVDAATYSIWTTKEEATYLATLTAFHFGKSLGFRLWDRPDPGQSLLELHFQIPSCTGKTLKIVSRLSCDIHPHDGGRMNWTVKIAASDEAVARILNIQSDTELELLDIDHDKEHKRSHGRIQGEHLKAIVKALAMPNSEQVQTMRAVLSYLLLCHAHGVPAYYHELSCKNPLSSVLLPVRVLQQYPSLAQIVELVEALQMFLLEKFTMHENLNTKIQ